MYEIIRRDFYLVKHGNVQRSGRGSCLFKWPRPQPLFKHTASVSSLFRPAYLCWKSLQQLLKGWFLLLLLVVSLLFRTFYTGSKNRFFFLSFWHKNWKLCTPPAGPQACRLSRLLSSLLLSLIQFTFCFQSLPPVVVRFMHLVRLSLAQGVKIFCLIKVVARVTHQLPPQGRSGVGEYYFRARWVYEQNSPLRTYL